MDYLRLMIGLFCFFGLFNSRRLTEWLLRSTGFYAWLNWKCAVKRHEIQLLRHPIFDEASREQHVKTCPYCRFMLRYE